MYSVIGPMVDLSRVAIVKEYGHNPGWQGTAPDECRSVYRLLCTLVYLRLIKGPTLVNSTTRLKVAKMVISKLLKS